MKLKGFLTGYTGGYPNMVLFVGVFALIIIGLGTLGLVLSLIL